MPSVDSPEKLHYLLTRHIIDTGHAPSLAKLAELAELPEARTEALLKTLDQMHGVILVPNLSHIWSLHPFALNPTQVLGEHRKRRLVGKLRVVLARNRSCA
jgi:hypothetical protein